MNFYSFLFIKEFEQKSLTPLMHKYLNHKDNLYYFYLQELNRIEYILVTNGLYHKRTEITL